MEKPMQSLIPEMLDKLKESGDHVQQQVLDLLKEESKDSEELIAKPMSIISDWCRQSIELLSKHLQEGDVAKLGSVIQPQEDKYRHEDDTKFLDQIQKEAESFIEEVEEKRVTLKTELESVEQYQSDAKKAFQLLQSLDEKYEFKETGREQRLSFKDANHQTLERFNEVGKNKQQEIDKKFALMVQLRNDLHAQFQAQVKKATQQINPLIFKKSAIFGWQIEENEQYQFPEDDQEDLVTVERIDYSYQDVIGAIQITLSNGKQSKLHCEMKWTNGSYTFDRDRPVKRVDLRERAAFSTVEMIAFYDARDQLIHKIEGRSKKGLTKTIKFAEHETWAGIITSTLTSQNDSYGFITASQI